MKISIVPDFSSYLHIEFDVDDPNPEIRGSVWVSPSTNYVEGISNAIGNFKNGHNHFYIDPQYYAAHVSTTYDKFNFWLNPNPNPTLSEGEQQIVLFYNVEVYQEDFLDNIEGDNVKELFKSVDNQISDIKNSIPSPSDDFIVSPSGNKYMISATDNGQIVLIPFIPTKMAFFGNSLIGGFGYGMAASDSRHDYYYLITEYIKTLNSSATAVRNPASANDFETGSTEQ